MELVRIVQSMIEGERDAVANMANVAAVIWEQMPRLNWAGFYVAKPMQVASAVEVESGTVDEACLVLGPFQGRPACIRIPFGRGVCGKSAATKRTIIVPDVDAFEDHIVCDSHSRSELVVPILVNNRVVAVIDIDSPHLSRFTEQDAEVIEQVAAYMAAGCDW